MLPNVSYGKLAGNFCGGLNAAFFTLPYSIAYGIVATSPLGVEAISLGMMLGLFSSIISGLTGPLFGSRTVLIGTPRAATALLYASVLQGLILLPEFRGSTPIETFQKCLPILSVLTGLGGFFVLVLNRYGLSGLVSKMPVPVIRGYILASTLLSIYKQIPLLIGVSSIYLLANGYWATLVGAGTAAASYFLLIKIFPRSPAAIFAFFGGSILIGIFSIVGNIELRQFQLGDIQDLSVLYENGFNWFRFPTEALPSLFAFIGPVLIALVFFISLEAHITLAHLESSYKIDSNVKTELNAIGWANIACGVLGSIPCGYYISGAASCLNSGAKDRKSEWFYAFFVLIVLLTAPVFLSGISTPVLGAVVITASFMTMDKWVFHTIKDIWTKKDWSKRKTPIVSVSVSLTVVLTALLLGFQAAIVVGVTLTTIIFLLQQSESLIKAEFSLRQKRSSKMRNSYQNEVIERDGALASIISLQGNLFFGNYNQLKKKLAGIEQCKAALIDCSHLIDIDITGAECLRSIVTVRKSKGLSTWVSGLANVQNAEEIISTHPNMDDLNNAAKKYETGNFLVLDDGLELMEDTLLISEVQVAQKLSHNKTEQGCAPEQTDLLLGLNTFETEVVINNARIVRYDKGKVLFEAGEQGDGIYALLNGRVGVYVSAGQKKARIMSYAPGVLFGEMAVIDKQPRMADAIAEEESALLHLSSKAIDQLQIQHPEITQKMYLNIAKVLSTRLRTAMRELKQ